MNPRGANKFGEFWLICESCKAVIAPASKRALFGSDTLLLTKRMPALRQCPSCGSNALLRGELLDIPASALSTDG